MSIETTRRTELFPFAARINRVSTVEPWRWLAAGWSDLRRTRLISVPYSLLFVAAGYAVTFGLYHIEAYHLIWPALTGFFLAAPAFAVGYYEASRRLEAGERVGFTDILTAWRRYPSRIFGTGLALCFFLILWIRTAALIYALNYPYEMLTVQGVLNQTFFSLDGLMFLAAGTVIGAGFAVAAFLFAAISLPMILGERADFLPAVITSAIAVTRNPRAMALWAVIIVVITGFGMVTALIGLIVTMPLIGHASWHAYRALVRPADD
ncbi:MAG: DUF2189 domain-containing protein [Rhodospirillales bacterium]